MIRACWSIISVLCLVCGPAFLLAADTSAYSIEKVTKAWADRQARIVSLRCEAEGETSYLKGPASEQLPEQDGIFPRKAKWLLHFNNNWARKEVEEYLRSPFGKREYAPFYSADFYNGSAFRRYKPREKNTSEAFKPAELQPDLLIQSDEARSVFLLATDFPVLIGAGRPPRVAMDPNPKTLSNPITPTDFVVHGRGTLANRECIIVKSAKSDSAGIDELWVDPERDHVIVRWSRYVDGILGGLIWARLDIAYKESDGGWLLDSWTVSHYSTSEPNRLVRSERMKVTLLEINPTMEKAQFEINPSPGRIVNIAGDTNAYRVQEDGSLQEVIRPESGNAVSTPTLVLISTLIAFVLLLLRWRWARLQVR